MKISKMHLEFYGQQKLRRLIRNEKHTFVSIDNLINHQAWQQEKKGRPLGGEAYRLKKSTMYKINVNNLLRRVLNNKEGEALYAEIKRLVRCYATYTEFGSRTKFAYLKRIYKKMKTKRLGVN